MPFLEQLTKQLQGMSGGTIIEDTDVHIGQWVSFVVREDATFTELEINIDGLVLPKTFFKGETVGGQINSLQLSSGKIIAYKGVR